MYECCLVMKLNLHIRNFMDLTLFRAGLNNLEIFRKLSI